MLQDSPELPGLIAEFEASLTSLSKQLAPLRACSLKQHSRALGTFVDLKYNLLLSYCSFLSFYLLLKSSGQDVRSHPVLHKITTLKQTLDGLAPLDEKLDRLL